MYPNSARTSARLFSHAAGGIHTIHSHEYLEQQDKNKSTSSRNIGIQCKFQVSVELVSLVCLTH
jgi:hypothetical protein